jgi:ABC-type transport system substrate-binding protein
VRREAGRQLELAGNPDFFLGAPKLDRVVILTAGDPDAMMNLVLDGTADAFEALSPVSGPPRLAANKTMRIELAPSFTVISLLFNQRAFGDRTRSWRTATFAKPSPWESIGSPWCGVRMGPTW